MSMYKLKIANIFGLDAENPQHGVLLIDSLDGIIDKDAFVEYLRAKKDTIQYENRVEKLDRLANRYKKSDMNIPIEVRSLLPTETEKTVNKFKESIAFLRDHEEILADDLSLLRVERIPWFTKAEISRLKHIGGLRKCISVYEEGNLYEVLYSVSVKRYISGKKQTAIGSGKNRANEMAKRLIKKG